MQPEAGLMCWQKSLEPSSKAPMHPRSICGPGFTTKPPNDGQWLSNVLPMAAPEPAVGQLPYGAVG